MESIYVIRTHDNGDSIKYLRICSSLASIYVCLWMISMATYICMYVCVHACEHFVRFLFHFNPIAKLFLLHRRKCTKPFTRSSLSSNDRKTYAKGNKTDGNILIFDLFFMHTTTPTHRERHTYPRSHVLYVLVYRRTLMIEKHSHGQIDR